MHAVSPRLTMTIESTCGSAVASTSSRPRSCDGPSRPPTNNAGTSSDPFRSKPTTRVSIAPCRRSAPGRTRVGGATGTGPVAAGLPPGAGRPRRWQAVVGRGRSLAPASSLGRALWRRWLHGDGIGAGGEDLEDVVRRGVQPTLPCGGVETSETDLATSTHLLTPSGARCERGSLARRWWGEVVAGDDVGQPVGLRQLEPGPLRELGELRRVVRGLPEEVLESGG